MSSKKKSQMTRHCRIFQWLEGQDPEFAAAIRDLCMEGALSPGPRMPGVTLLYPKDKAYRAEIIDKAYSDDADEAVKMVESLIVPDALLAAADFTRRPIGSRAGILYPVEAADGAKVRLAGGVELAPCEDFKPLARRADDISVWIITKGRLPLVGEAYRAPRPEREKRGRGEAAGTTAAFRQALAKSTAEAYLLFLRRDPTQPHNPYLCAVVSLLACMRDCGADLDAALAALDYDPAVSFYLLVEPFKTAGEYLVPDAAMVEWKGAARCGADPVAEFRALFAPPADRAAAIWTDRAGVNSAVDRVRQRVSNPQQLPAAVLEAYAALEAQNTIDGTAGVLTPEAQAALAGGRKLWQDLFRFHVRSALAAATSLVDAAKVLAALPANWPGNDFAKEARARLEKGAVPRDFLLELSTFVNSTDFLYFPVPPALLGGAWGGAHEHTLTHGGIHNANFVAHQRLDRR